MKFKNYLASEEVTLVTEGTKANVITLEEDFNEENLIKVGKLICSLATKKIGAGKFTFILKETFRKANGQTGVGALFVSDKGIMMRFNYLSTTKKGYSVNSIDYWKGRKIGDNPNKSIMFAGQNIIQVTDQLFDYLKNGTLDEAHTNLEADDFLTFSLLESTPKERKALRVAFATKHGIKIGYADGASGLRKAAIRAGVVDEFDKEFGGIITVAKDQKEKTSTQEKFETSQGLFEDPNYYADPKYVFEDIEQATKVIAEGRWRSLIVAGMGGIGKCAGYINKVNTKGLE